MSLNLVGNYANQQDIRTYASSTSPNNSVIKNARTLLSDSKSVMIDPFSMVALSKISDNRIISSAGTMSLDFYRHTLNLSDEEFSRLVNPAQNGFDESISFAISQSEDSDLFTLVYHSYATGPLYFFFTFDLTKTFAFSEREDETLVIGLDDVVVYTYGSLNREDVADIFHQPGLRNYSVTLSSQEFSTSLGTLRYAYIVPRQAYFSALTRNFLIFFLIALLALILSFVISYHMTRRAYSPLRSVVASIGGNLPERKDNEVSYISEALQKAANSNKALQLKLDDQKTIREDRFIRNLLFGSLTPADIQQGLLEFRFLQMRSPFIATVLEYIDYSRYLEAFSKESLALIKDTIYKLADNSLSGLEYHRILDIGSDRMSLVTAGSDTASLSVLLRLLLNRIEEELSVSLFAAVGSPVTSITEIDSSFSDALYVSQNRILGLKYTTICTPDDIQEGNKGSILYYPLETETALIDTVLSENRNQALRLLDDLLNENFPNHTFQMDLFSQFSLMLTSTLHRIIAGLHKRPEDFFPEGIQLLREKEHPDITALRERFTEILDSILTNIHTQRSEQQERITQTMRDYVEHNYSRNISLFDLAEYLNLSHEYTSRLFKKKMDISFKDYLSQTRYRTAMEMIDRSPGLKVKELAALVGCNTDMLARIFVRYSGMTPAEYIKKKNQEI